MGHSRPAAAEMEAGALASPAPRRQAGQGKPEAEELQSQGWRADGLPGMEGRASIGLAVGARGGQVKHRGQEHLLIIR